MPNYPYTFQLPPLNVQDIPNDGVAGEFLGINGSGVLDWLTAGGGGTGDMLKADNLSGLTSYPTARTNLGLGTGDSPTFANLTLTSPSLSSSAPVTISQTWNNAAVAFTGLKVNAVSTASASGSLLLDLQVGGVSQFKVSKVGDITTTGINCTNIVGTTGYFDGSVRLNNNAAFLSFGSPQSVFLQRDGADNTLALRNGANAQTFNVYGTYSTSPSLAYSRLAIACDTSGNATLTTQSTGVAGTVSINGVPVGLGKGNISTNVAVGTGALNTNTVGANNTILGKDALLNSTSGSWNVIIGTNASKATIGVNNYTTVVGGQAMENCVTSNYNSAFGQGAGYFISTGAVLTSSQNSVFLGALSRPLGNVETNQIVIGYEAVGIGSNSVVLGNDSITKTALKGNVGIGTTAPGAKLDVYLNPANNFATEKIAFGNGITFANFNSGALTGFWLTNTGTPVAPSATNYSLLSNGSATILNTGADLYFGVNGSYKAIINSSGNVGIGTTSPTSKLHVAGELGTNLTTFDSGAAVKITNTTATGKSWLLTSGIVNIHNEFFCIRQESVSQPALIIAPTTNNVGIGVNSPPSKLTVASGDIEVSTAASGLILKSPDGTRYRITVPNGGASLTITAV